MRSGSAAACACWLGACAALASCGDGTDGALAPDVSEEETPGAAQDDDGEAGTEIDERIAGVPDEPRTDRIEPEAVGAIVTCVLCHGGEGEGNEALDAPRIGALPAWYLARQLDHFRRGVRGGSDEDKYGTQMRAITLTLNSDEAIADLAAYFADLSPPYGSSDIQGDVERGAELYEACTACHGADGRGSEELGAPDLIGQHDWYLVRQLEHFRDGLRGAHPEDVYGMQMRPFVLGTLMSDEDIVDVVAYIQSLPGRTGEGENGAPQASASR